MPFDSLNSGFFIQSKKEIGFFLQKDGWVFYESILRALEKHEVRYAIVGGVAVNLHGIPRMTADLDLIVDLSKENLEKLLTAMKEVGYLPRLPVAPEELLSPEKREEWITQKNLMVFTFRNLT